MADNRHNNIFSDTACISMEFLEKYANDTLSPSEQQAVENHLVDCELCSDALEGLTFAEFSPEIKSSVVSLNERIAAKITESNSKAFNWKKQYTSLAAAVIGIMIMSVVLLNYFKTADIAKQEYISEGIKLETPPPEKQIVPLSDEESIDGQDEFTSTSTTLDGEGQNLQEKVEIETKLEYKDEDKLEPVEEMIAKTASTSSTNQLANGSGLIISGDGKLNDSEMAAEVALDDYDSDYRLDRTIDESKIESKILKEESEEEELAAGSSTISLTSATKAKEQTVAPMDIVAHEQSYKGKSRKKNNKSKAVKNDNFGFNSQATESAKTTVQKDAERSENNNSEALQAPSEYDDPNTLFNDAKSEVAAPARPSDQSIRAGTSDADQSAVESVTESFSSISANEVTTTTADSTSVAANGDLMSEQAPMFQGGQANLRQYLADNMVYPDSADCKVTVSFTVNADSTISDAIVLTPIGSGCDEEALRLINKMPNWVPAQQRGRQVTSQYQLDIDFTERARNTAEEKSNEKKSGGKKSRAKF